MDNSPLTQLPAEVRNRIYELALITAKAVVISKHERSAPWQAPALLQSCRQIRKEGSWIYYSANIFTMNMDHFFGRTLLVNGEKREMHRFLAKCLRALGTANRSLIQTIRLDDQFHLRAEVRSRIKECRGHLEDEGIAVDQADILVEIYEKPGRPKWVSA